MNPTAGPTTARPQWTATIGGLVAAVLASFIGFGAVVPVLPILVTRELSGSPFAVGLVFAASGLVTLATRPYAGLLAQRYGSRRIMLAGAVLASVVGALYALPLALSGALDLPGLGLPGLLANRLLMGVAESLVFTAGSVWTVALAPEDRRAQLVGYYGLAMWSGWTIGPLLGVWLHDARGYGAVWLAAALLPLGTVLVLLFLPADRPTGPGVSRRLVPPSVLLPGAALALAAFGYAALTGFVVLHLDARGIARGATLLSLFAAAYVLVRLLAGRLPDRVGARPIVLGCGLAEAVGLVLIAVAPAWWVAALGAVVMGGGFTLLYPALALVVINRAPAAERGAALGSYTSFWDLGIGVAGLATGIVALAGYPWVFALAALLAAGAAATGLLATRGPETPAPG